MDFHNILFVITTISLFVSGYSFRKHSIIGLTISALFAQISVLFDIASVGISKYGQNLIRSSLNSFVIAITYCTFFWAMGYMIGGINLKKKDNTDELYGKTDEYMRFDFDDNK